MIRGIQAWMNKIKSKIIAPYSSPNNASATSFSSCSFDGALTFLFQIKIALRVLYVNGFLFQKHPGQKINPK